MNNKQLTGLCLATMAVCAYAKAPPPQPDYQAMTVRNFVIDGPQLAATQTRVRLTGFYVRQGRVAMLYPDAQSVIMAQSNNANPPSVALLIDHASRALRESLLACDEDPAASQLGCGVNIVGHASMCTLSNAFGVAEDAPCVVAEDGVRWRGPP